MTAAGILAIPLVDMLGSSGVTYADGFKSVWTYVFAAGCGISLAAYLYRCDRKKGK